MISIKDLNKCYGEVRILENVNLEIGKTEPAVLFGPSGSGKTTLLRMIAGLEIPDSGSILMDEAVVSQAGWVLHPNKRNISIVFQSPALWPHLTVEKNILFGLCGIEKTVALEKLKSIVEETGIIGLEKRYPHQLSGGQVKRASLARALVQEKEFYLMDEPLVNQDDENKNKLIELIIKKVKEYKAGLLYITHDVEEAEKISKRIVKINGGKIEG